MQFKIKGGRGGSIEFEHNGRCGILDWEMLLGESAMIVYSQGCKWVTNPGEIMVMPEILEIVQAICDKQKWKIEIQFESRTEILKPR